MSKIALTPNASGTGTLSIVAPNTNTDRTLTLPDVSETLIGNTSLRTELNASGSAPIYAARAWVNFNGTGTVAIRASGNVTSITDNGVGRYTVNFATAMQDANYSIVATSQGFGSGDNGNSQFNIQGSSNNYSAAPQLMTESAVNVAFGGSGATFFDTNVNCVAVFR